MGIFYSLFVNSFCLLLLFCVPALTLSTRTRFAATSSSKTCGKAKSETLTSAPWNSCVNMKNGEEKLLCVSLTCKKKQKKRWSFFGSRLEAVKPKKTWAHLFLMCNIQNNVQVDFDFHQKKEKKEARIVLQNLSGNKNSHTGNKEPFTITVFLGLIPSKNDKYRH